MKPLTTISNHKHLAVAAVITFVLTGCDSGALLVAEPANNDLLAEDTLVPEDVESTLAEDVTADETVAPTAIGTATSIAVDSAVVSSTDNDASGGAVATAFLADRAALGPIKIMACLLYTSPSPRDRTRSRMPSSA